MNAQHLQQWISHPENLDRDTLYELRALLARYPYFQSARLLYLKNLYLLHDITFGQELRKAALYVADRQVLFYIIEGNKFTIESKKKEEFSSSAKDEPNLDRTLSLIDSFLSSLPEEPLPTKIKFDMSADYTTYLLKEDSTENQEESAIKEEQLSPKLRGQELIDGFIEKAENDNAIMLQATEEQDEESLPSEETNTDENEDDESCFTETLAKIYVKQQRYSKALEIIKKLSLKYPKKNAYFADQIRFLEKLIINAKSK
ncbi:tetratricopeptide repeat protein [uncultured Bacteroides sp.]|uniref:tetratricopeptide repeat protein n=1 Tax=uncultured Bacteroides sp. TaxID=162156 RepID=UPI002AA91743|nr:tetratricopeptide repeat protein [uncultured Bacteroides sp.]